MFDIQAIAKHIAGADNHFADMLSRNNVIQLEKGQWKWCWNWCCLPEGNTDSNTISSLHYITSFLGLDLTLIQNMLHRYFDNGISSATCVTYAAGQQKYLDFVLQFIGPHFLLMNIPFYFLLPTLPLLVCHTPPPSVYLSAVRNMHVATGYQSIYSLQLTPHLQQVLKGIKKTQAISQPPRISRPIILDIMSSIFHLLLYISSYDHVMIWATCCMAFLRSSEHTVPSQDGYNPDPSVHLSLSDVAVDSRSSPSMIRVRIKQSKTDPFRPGINLYLGKLMLLLALLKVF